jgi:hypothetical protein
MSYLLPKPPKDHAPHTGSLSGRITATPSPLKEETTLLREEALQKVLDIRSFEGTAALQSKDPWRYVKYMNRVDSFLSALAGLSLHLDVVLPSHSSKDQWSYNLQKIDITSPFPKYMMYWAQSIQKNPFHSFDEKGKAYKHRSFTENKARDLSDAFLDIQRLLNEGSEEELNSSLTDFSQKWLLFENAFIQDRKAMAKIALKPILDCVRAENSLIENQDDIIIIDQEKYDQAQKVLLESLNILGETLGIKDMILKKDVLDVAVTEVSSPASTSWYSLRKELRKINGDECSLSPNLSEYTSLKDALKAFAADYKTFSKIL